MAINIWHCIVLTSEYISRAPLGANFANATNRKKKYLRVKAALSTKLSQKSLFATYFYDIDWGNQVIT
jgi:hypothetical protein